jgi:SAM-dependent methyltransferase
MLNALLNDIFQRVLTFNKLEQKANLSKKLGSLSLKPGTKCVDFGCGTGLFAGVFAGRGFRYYGYDIDKSLTDYASRLSLSDSCFFTASPDHLKGQAPFGLIMANCCFHHIDDALINKVLEDIKGILADDGVFLLIDILFAEKDTSVLRGLFRKLERGAYVRKAEDYRTIVERVFTVTSSEVRRSHLFSLKGIPVYNDLLMLTCKKR